MFFSVSYTNHPPSPHHTFTPSPITSPIMSLACTCDDLDDTQTLTVTDGRSSTCSVSTSGGSTTCTLDMYISDSMQEGTATIAYSGDSSYHSNLKDVCSSGECKDNAPFTCIKYTGAGNCSGVNDSWTCTVTTTDDDGKKSCSASIAYEDKSSTLTQSYTNKYAFECAQDESCTAPGWDITKNCKCG